MAKKKEKQPAKSSLSKPSQKKIEKVLSPLKTSVSGSPRISWVWWVGSCLSLAILGLLWFYSNFEDKSSPCRIGVPARSVIVESELLRDKVDLSALNNAHNPIRKLLNLGEASSEAQILGRPVGQLPPRSVPEEVSTDITGVGSETEAQVSGMKDWKEPQSAEALYEANLALRLLEARVIRITQSRDELYRGIGLLSQFLCLRNAFTQGELSKTSLDQFNQRILSASAEVQTASASLVHLLERVPGDAGSTAYGLWTSFPQVLDKLSVMMRPKPKNTWERLIRLVTDRVSVRPLDQERTISRKGQQFAQLQLLGEKGDLRGVVRIIESFGEEERMAIQEWLEKAQRALALQEAFTMVEKTILSELENKERDF